MTNVQKSVIESVKKKLCFGGIDYIKETEVNEEQGICIVTITTGAVEVDCALVDDCYLFCVGKNGGLFRYNDNATKKRMNVNDVCTKCRIY